MLHASITFSLVQLKFTGSVSVFEGQSGILKVEIYDRVWWEVLDEEAQLGRVQRALQD